MGRPKGSRNKQEQVPEVVPERVTKPEPRRKRNDPLTSLQTAIAKVMARREVLAAELLGLDTQIANMRQALGVTKPWPAEIAEMAQEPSPEVNLAAGDTMGSGRWA